MNRSIVMICFATFLAFGSSSLAQAPPGLSKKGKTPPGFDQGRKAGWHDIYPPGWDKKSKENQDRWKQGVKEGRAKVSIFAKEKDLGSEDVTAAEDAFEKAVRRGLDLEESFALTKEGIAKGKKGHGLSSLVEDEAERLLQQRSQKQNKGKSHGKGKPKHKQ